MLRDLDEERLIDKSPRASASSEPIAHLTRSRGARLSSGRLDSPGRSNDASAFRGSDGGGEAEAILRSPEVDVHERDEKGPGATGGHGCGRPAYASTADADSYVTAATAIADSVGAARADKQVARSLARKAEKSIHESAAAERVTEADAVNAISRVGATNGHAVAARLRRCGEDAARTERPRRITPHEVGTWSATDALRPGAGNADHVVTGPPDDKILTGTGIQEVVSRPAEKLAVVTAGAHRIVLVAGIDNCERRAVKVAFHSEPRCRLHRQRRASGTRYQRHVVADAPDPLAAPADHEPVALASRSTHDEQRVVAARVRRY